MESYQRFLCSPAPQLSPLKPQIRTRKRSKTSSAAGDSLAVNREEGNLRNDSGSEPKPHNSKDKLPSNSVKTPRKLSKNKKTLKRKLGSFQNAVVLAPFHTLKKSFQNKLISFYSFEKLKKINNKAKVSKKGNMSFEYDIIELKPQNANVKKERKTASKSNKKSKPGTYCRCKKSNEKTDKKQSGSSPKLKRKTSNKELLVFGTSEVQTKKKKPNSEGFTPDILKSNFDAEQNYYISNNQQNWSDSGQSSSVFSSPSEGDSWETFTNSRSSKEEYLEGALAISTSSFDCYLESFDKNVWDVGGLSRCNKTVKGVNALEPFDSEFYEKPFRHTSRHLILERKNSDGQIVDFIDREPQIEVISPEESHHHLQPLLVQNRAKDKKQESESICCSKKRDSNLSRGKTSRESSRDSRQKRSDVKSVDESKTEVSQVEVGTQVELEEEESQPGPRNNNQQVEEFDSFNVNVSREKTPELPFNNSISNFFKKSLPPESEVNSAQTKIQLSDTRRNSSEEFPNVGSFSSDFCQKLSSPKL